MKHIDTAYKLGSLAAVDNFTAWLQNDDGNPTEYPKRRGSILKTAVIDTGGGMGQRPQPVSPQMKIPSWAQDKPTAASPGSALFEGTVDPWADEGGARIAPRRTTRPAARPSPARAAGSNAAAAAFTPDLSQMSMASKPDTFTGEPSPRGMSMAPKAAPAAMASKSDPFTGGLDPRGMSMAPKAAPTAVASKSDTYTGHLGSGGGRPADVMTGQSRMPAAAPAAQAKAAPASDVYTGHLPQKVSHTVRKTAAAIRKMANTPMTPNPNVTAPPAQTQPAGNPAANAIGKPPAGMGGAAPIAVASPSGGGGRAVTASVHRIKMAIIGGKSQTCKDMPEVCNPGTPPPPKPQPQPAPTPPPKTAADHAVEQVMRKLGKSMSRRPLSRDDTKYEAIKKKLRKQKPKKD